MWDESKIMQSSATEGLIHLLCQAVGEGMRQSLFPAPCNDAGNFPAAADQPWRRLVLGACHGLVQTCVFLTVGLKGV